MYLVCVPERLCPHCLLCLSTTEHLSEASCQSVAFHQIVHGNGNFYKTMKAGQQFTATKQTNYLFDFDLFFVRTLLMISYGFHKQNKTKKTHWHKKALFFRRKTIFFPYNSKTSKKSWKSQSSWHELFVSYFPRDHQLLVAAVMCWGECTGGFPSITASRHSRFLPDRSVRCAEFSVDLVPWCTGAVRGSEPTLQILSLTLWKLSVVLKASAWGSYLELSMVP